MPLIMILPSALNSLPAAAEPTLVFAASSLSGALDAVVSDYQTSSSADIRVSFAASSSLARQLVQGAPADIFISANTAWMKYAEDRQAIQSASKVALIRNQLVLARPYNKVTYTAQLSADYLQNQLKTGRFVLADPTHVPAGLYAKEALESMKLWHIVKHRLAPAINVRAVLALLERGEAPIGILYKTDALASRNVNIISTFPPSSHTPIRYIAALGAQPASQSVSNFFRYLRSPAAMSRWYEFGFDPT